MPLRPIDAIFVDPMQRLYVIYQRGELWQLPRMKIDMAAWQRRHLYSGDKNTLYLSRRQAIDDIQLAQQLRTLNLPTNTHGISLPRFEAWWEVQGFSWLKELLNQGTSPLAAHQNLLDTKDILAADVADNTAKIITDKVVTDKDNAKEGVQTALTNSANSDNDIFAAMLAELSAEVLNHR